MIVFDRIILDQGWPLGPGKAEDTTAVIGKLDTNRRAFCADFQATNSGICVPAPGYPTNFRLRESLSR